MVALNEKLVKQALALPSDMRAALVDRLLVSLNLPSQKQIDKLWAKEAERRIDEIDSGRARPVPGESVFAEVRKRYGR
jgi:putative addiction module component (TIGR02574 family)